VTWRQQHVNRSEDSGEAANDANPDHDGLANIAEYAFGSDPWIASAAAQPRPILKEGYLTIEFTASAENIGVNFGASRTRDVQAGDWQTLADEGQENHHVFRIPMDGSKGFIRLHITSR